MPIDTTISPATKTITLGNLDLKSVITQIGNINKFDSEIKFTYDKSISTYTGPGYSVIYQLYNEPDKPKFKKAFPGYGGVLDIICIDALNLRISISDWDSISADTTLQVTLGSQTKDIDHGTSEIIFDNVTFNKTSESDVAFIIVVNNLYGSNKVNALLPLKITWSAT